MKPNPSIEFRVQRIEVFDIYCLELVTMWAHPGHNPLSYDTHEPHFTLVHNGLIDLTHTYCSRQSGRQVRIRNHLSFVEVCGSQPNYLGEGFTEAVFGGRELFSTYRMENPSTVRVDYHQDYSYASRLGDRKAQEEVFIYASHEQIFQAATRERERQRKHREEVEQSLALSFPGLFRKTSKGY